MEYDIAIIGGGIFGTGIAADAAKRGLRVLLCEKGDLASGTSSSSSKLIHGGLRYLESYQFHLVHEALHERDVLLHIAPHLVKPIPFIFPHSHQRPWWKVRLGMWLYDVLTHHKQIPRAQTIQFQKNNPLKAHYTKGMYYWDCQTDDARLVISNALAAQQHGAHIATHTACIDTKRNTTHWDMTLSNGKIVRARALINATGPSITHVFKHALHQRAPYEIHLVKGSHIIVPRWYDGPHAYTLQHLDERIIFVLPYGEQHVLIGTTDIPVDNPHDIHASPDEIHYLITAVNRHFKQSLTYDDVVYSFAGVRGLYGKYKEAASKISRDYKLHLDTHAAPLLSIFGGKLTTYRLIAQKAVSRLAVFFPALPESTTATTPLPGGDFPQGIDNFKQQLAITYPFLPTTLLERYVHTYGNRCQLFLEGVKTMEDLGNLFGANLYEKEVRYLVEHEWAHTSHDILWRRTKLDWLLSSDEKKALAHFLLTIH